MLNQRNVKTAATQKCYMSVVAVCQIVHAKTLKEKKRRNNMPTTSPMSRLWHESHKSEAPQPDTIKCIEAAVLKITYLRGQEAHIRRRASLLLRLYKAQNDRALELEAARLALQRKYIPIHILPTTRKPDFKQPILSKDALLKSWQDLSTEALEAKIAALEATL